MADDGTFIKNADIQARCGTAANATAKAVAATDVYVKNVEAHIAAATRYDWVTNWASLTTNLREILTECGACICAMYVIQWDMSGFPSREHAETMLDFLHYRVVKCMEHLNEAAVRKAMGAS